MVEEQPDRLFPTSLETKAFSIGNWVLNGRDQCNFGGHMSPVPNKPKPKLV